MFKKKIKKSRVLPIVFDKKNKFNETMCIICLKDFKNNEICLPCGHVFHGDCILTWFEKKMECPCCKIRLSWSPKVHTEDNADNK
jgi:hypothetical protein